MKRPILAAMLVALASCSGPSLSEYQESCETQHRKFSVMVDCLQLTVKNDWELLSRYKNSDLVRLYLLHAENLSKKVSNRKITAGEARVNLANFYAQLKKTSSQRGSKPSL